MQLVRLTDLRPGVAIGLIALITLAGCLRGADLRGEDLRDSSAKGAAFGAPEPISVTALPPPPDTVPDPRATDDSAQVGAQATVNATASKVVTSSAPRNAEDPAKGTATPPLAPQNPPDTPPPLPLPTTVFGRKVQQDLQDACTQAGGIFGPRGKSGALACFATPPDAGKACTRKSDCIGQCLARSRTCAPVIPLVGCNEVLLESGARVTECLE